MTELQALERDRLIYLDNIDEARRHLRRLEPKLEIYNNARDTDPSHLVCSDLIRLLLKAIIELKNDIIEWEQCINNIDLRLIELKIPMECDA